MEKTKEQLIEDYKKSNKERREKMAIKAGFKTGADYLASLQTRKPAKVEKVTKFNGTFYVIDILDATGSMAGGKYNNSTQGIVSKIKEMAIRKDIVYSLVEFIQKDTPFNNAVKNQSPSAINTSSIPFYGANGGNTPLYYAVWKVIADLYPSVTKKDKVLINVYTDGENNSMYEYQQQAADLIKKVQKENFTVTFVATPSDLNRIMRDINIEESNTLATANTAEGFRGSMVANSIATMSYFASADAGQDVLRGFYKKEGKL